MRDIDVRIALRREVLRRHEGQPDTLVVHELGLRHGAARVDIAVVNGRLHGYEIKSDADTLERLPSQVSIYSAVLDVATLVVGHRHAAKALRLLPEWWGVKVATEGPRGGICLRELRRGQPNPGIDPVAVAELLWRDEAADMLRAMGYPTSTARKSRTQLYHELVSVLSVDELRARVRHALKSRETRPGRRPLG